MLFNIEMMGLINTLFKRSKVECPRCLGKGHVGLEDIKRLNKELKWLPGSCAYCKSKGQVTERMLSNVSFNSTYVTLDLSNEERDRIFRKDVGAEHRAKRFDEDMDLYIKEIEYLYFEGHMKVEKIVNFYMIAQENFEGGIERDQLLEYINKVIAYRTNIIK